MMLYCSTIEFRVFLSDVLSDVIGVTSSYSAVLYPIAKAVLPRLTRPTCVFSKAENRGRFYPVNANVIYDVRPLQLDSVLLCFWDTDNETVQAPETTYKGLKITAIIDRQDFLSETRKVAKLIFIQNRWNDLTGRSR